MPRPTLLISDLHLDDARPAATQAFLRLLERSAGDVERLYILGDLFEAWIGDDDDAPLVTTAAGALRALAAAGTTTYFIHGNRDFLLGEQFAERAALTLLPEAVVHDIGGQPTLLMHGDSLCTGDTAYQAFRRISRDPAWQKQMLRRSLEERRAMARAARAASAEHLAQASLDIVDVDPDAVHAAMRMHGVTRMIHGHTHRPARHTFDLDGHPVERWVLGDWYEQGSALRASGTNLCFESLALS
jgi:UDP-2,3-diacylglucosamine hydrolase